MQSQHQPEARPRKQRASGRGRGRRPGKGSESASGAGGHAPVSSPVHTRSQASPTESLRRSFSFSFVNQSRTPRVNQTNSLYRCCVAYFCASVAPARCSSVGPGQRAHAHLLHISTCQSMSPYALYFVSTFSFFLLGLIFLSCTLPLCDPFSIDDQSSILYPCLNCRNASAFAADLQALRIRRTLEQQPPPQRPPAAAVAEGAHGGGARGGDGKLPVLLRS